MAKKNILTFFIKFFMKSIILMSVIIFLVYYLLKKSIQNHYFPSLNCTFFYQVYNIILFNENNSSHYCFCDKVPGYSVNIDLTVGV